MPSPSPSIQAAKARLSGTVQFVSGDIWRTRLSDMPPWKSRFIRMLRVLLLAIRGFKEDACMLRASSLTFYTMLSIVPVAAMAFGIASRYRSLLFPHPQNRRLRNARAIPIANCAQRNASGGGT